jgi:hypothetical protein
MEEKKQIILPTKEYANAISRDLDYNVELESTQNLMRLGDRDIVLNLNDLFGAERAAGIDYKIFGKLKMIFRNMYTGATSFPYLEEKLFLVGDGSTGFFEGYLPYDEFAFLRRDVYRQITSFTNIGGVYSGITNTTGDTRYQTITPIEAPYHNWNLYLTYAYSGDTNYPMSYTLSGGTMQSFVASDGIPFRISSTGSTYLELTSPVEHGMNQGEYVFFSGITNPFYINAIGNEIYNSEKYVINIALAQIPTGVTFNTIMTAKRCLDIKNTTGTTSQYYVHRLKTLTDVNDYIMDNVGFETPVFADEKKMLFQNSVSTNDVVVERNRMESVLFDFKEPLKLTGFTNNLGYTPTEVFVTTVFRNGAGYFNYPPKVGFKFNFHNSWIDEHFDGVTSNETTLSGTTYVDTISGVNFISGNTLPVGTEGLVGAFIEYNPREMNERIISEAFHKITNPIPIFNYGQDGNVDGFSGATTGNTFGLYYQPHHRVMLKQLSPYVENSKTDNPLNTNVVLNMPDNAIYDPVEQLWRWRDVYDDGYIDPDGYGTNFPYANGNHYVRADINFYLRNERYYTNKQDGIADFNANAKNNPSDC